ncbi:helix-turn-helix transcriptional regulator [Brevundimonas sp. 2YAF1]|uniref:helix-turn-helix transcriptional regulator n=1 Tax=Brevundimonas sp. 2YAF1 TaxID=3233024 RepID=UPI003F9078FD
MPFDTSRPPSVDTPRPAHAYERDASSPVLTGSVLQKVAIRLLRPEEMASYFPAAPCEAAVTPMAWPLLLNKQQLASYLGMSGSTLAKICPVAPIDVGANLVRYSRTQIDEWVATLPARGGNGRQDVLQRTEPATDEATRDRRHDALSRVAARAKRASRSR